MKNLPNFLLLAVSNPAESAAFYEALLGRAPDEASPGFVLFRLENGLHLGLWIRSGMVPAPTAPGATEIGIPVTGDDALHAAHETLSGRGIAILQPVTAMDFGLTFVIADPDGHRIRFFSPSEG